MITKNLNRYLTLFLAFAIGVTMMISPTNDSSVRKVNAENTTVLATNSSLSSKIVMTDKYSNGYKFDPPVTVTTFRYYGPQVKFQAGESIDNNVWTKAYQDYCGVKLKSIFSVTDFMKFDLKVTMSIATNNLPDIMPLYTTLFFRVADSRKVIDLKPYYDKYLDPQLKDLMEFKSGGSAYKTSFRNSILAGIAQPPQSSPNMQWIRQDWLNKYKLQWPKTINDSIKIMKYFCAKNPSAPSSSKTYAFPLESSLSTLTGFANAFGAYQRIWIDDGKGGLVRSDISTKWKPVLKTLQDMFAQGYIDHNFTLTSYSDINQKMRNQQFGFYFGGATSPDETLYNTISKNPKAIWKQGLITDSAGMSAKMQVETRVSTFYSVNKKSKYPEALIFMANLYGDLANGIGSNYRKYHDFVGKDKVQYNSFFYPIVSMSYSLLDSTTMISEAIKKKDFSKLTGEQLGYVEKLLTWTEKKDPKGWSIWALFNSAGSFKTEKKILDSHVTYPDRGWGPETTTWIDKGPDLYYTNSEIFVKIIRGDYTVDKGFDLWTNYFKNNGGVSTTKEINLWWKNVGKTAFASVVF